MYKLIFLFFLLSQVTLARFSFKGVVNQSYYGGRAYLSLVKDCNKTDLFITEDILQDCEISQSGEFLFQGDFLEDDNQIYKIHIDHCNQPINSYKHLLNHCEFSSEVVFIANNNDNIYFPVNPLSQILCDIEESTNANSSAIIKLQEYEEALLTKLEFSKSDFQRQTIYTSYFKNLQKYSLTFNEPLVELFAYYMYAKDQAISTEAYLKDLKQNARYYDDLLNKLEESYPNSLYSTLYKNKLQKDRYPLVRTKQTVYQRITYGLAALLLLAIGYIIKIKRQTSTPVVEAKINYKEVLTPQEQNVFELMITHTNKEIAEELFVSVSTVKTHINNIYSKLSIRSRKEIQKFL